MTFSTGGGEARPGRGIDGLGADGGDALLLRAAETDRVPVVGWTLYPRSTVEDYVFPDESSREAYWESRRRLCAMFYRARVEALVAVQLGPIQLAVSIRRILLRLESDGGADTEGDLGDCGGADAREQW